MITCASLCPMTLLRETLPWSSHPSCSQFLLLQPALCPRHYPNGSCLYHLHLARVKGQFLSLSYSVSGRLTHLATSSLKKLFLWISLMPPSLVFILFTSAPSLSFSSTNSEWQLAQGSVFGLLVFTFTLSCYGSQPLLWLHSLHLLSDELQILISDWDFSSEI